MVRVSEPSAESKPLSSVVSFEELYRDWQSHVARWVRTLGARSADTDDLVQEIFLVASRGLSRFDGRHPAGWLFNITWRKVRDYRALAWNRRFFSRHCVPASDELLVCPQHPLSDLEVKEAVQRVEVALASLNENHQDAFLLFAVEGHTGEEISELHNVPINTVWARLRRTRLVLETHLRHIDLDCRVAPPRKQRQLANAMRKKL